MAKRNKPIVGLDIDPVGIHAAQVTTSGGTIAVERAAVVALEPGVVRDGEIQDVDALAEALKTLYRENKGLDRRVRVGVANQKLAVRTVDLPVIEDRKELDAAVRFQAQDVIPMPLDQVVLDWQPLEIVETPDGTRQRVLLVAARKDMVDRVVAAVRAAGLRLDGIDLGAFAMIRALHEGADEPETVLYAAVGGITNLAVARGTQPLFSRASGGGLEAIAVELAERRSLTLEHARGWLQHVGLNTPVDAIEGDAEIIADARHVLEEGVRKIGAEVRQTLDFHQMQVDGAPVSRVVLTGDAIAVEGFADGLGVELGLPVSAGRVAGEPEVLPAGRMTVAAGLAVSGAPSVNVLPPEERRAAGTAGRSEGAVYAVLGVLALGLVLMTVNVIAKNGVNDKKADLAKVKADVASAEDTFKALASYTDFAALREKRVETVRQIASSRFDWAHALGEVARTIPKDAWLLKLEGSVTSASAGGNGSLRASIPQPAIVVTGCTTSQSAVARVMSNLRRVDGVERVSLEKSEKLTGDAAAGGSSGAGGGDKGGSTSDCRNGNDFIPQFQITAWFTAPPALAPATTGSAGGTANASAGATGPGTTEGSGVASDPATQSPDSSSGQAPATGQASSTSTSAGGGS